MKRILLSAALVAICLAALAAPALAQSGNTWTINYYNNTDWAGYPVMTQYSPYISFNWGTGSPGPAVPVDNFSARMTTDAFFYAGTYQFSAVADDEMTVIIDGVTYLDTRGKAQSGKSFAFNVPMWQGNHRIEVLYREFTVDAYIYLSWLYLSGETTPPPPPTELNLPAGAALGQLGGDKVRRLHALPPAEHPPVELLRLGRRLGFTEPGLHPDGTADHELEHLRCRYDGDVHESEWAAAVVQLLQDPGRLVRELSEPAHETREGTGPPRPFCCILEPRDISRPQTRFEPNAAGLPNKQQEF